MFRFKSKFADIIHQTASYVKMSPLSDNGGTLSSSLYVIAKLKVADTIGDSKDMDVKEIAKKLGVVEEKLFKIIRYLSSEGYFILDGTKVTLTTEGNLLRRDGEHSKTSMAWCIIHANEEVKSRSLHEYLIDEVRTGQEIHILKYGKTIFELYKERPESAEAFTNCMAIIYNTLNPLTFSEYDFSIHTTLVDIGGGLGSAAKTILGLYHKSIIKDSNLEKAIVMDLPEIVAYNKEPVNNKLIYIGGNFFDASTIPSGDVMIINGVLHDWNDEECIQILKNCASKLEPNGRLIVIDNAVPEKSHPFFNIITRMDILMMIATSGSLRTFPEYDKLWNLSGLKLIETRETRSVNSLWILEKL